MVTAVSRFFVRSSSWRGSGSRRHAGFQRRILALVAASVMSLPVSVFAQLFDRATVIENARIVTQTGPVVERGSIVIKGGRIVELGSEVSAPMFSKKIDAAGKTVSPGLIDVWSGLGHAGASSSADPTSRASDAVATYDHEAFRDALRNGVTTMFVGTNGGAGVNGIGAVLQLSPGESGPIAKIIDDDAALCVDFGSSESALGRLKTFQKVRKAFKKAEVYRRALEDYDEELKEYIEKLEERRKEKEKEEAEEAGDEKDADDESKPKKKGDSDDESGGDKDKDKEKDKDKPKPKPDPKPDPKPKPKPKPDPKPDGAGLRPLLSGARGADGENGKKPGNDKGGDKKDGDKDGDDEDDDELEKPEQPAPDRKSDVLLRAIDHELIVRIRAYRSASILNALELADEFKIDIVIEGATEAYLVADQLAEAKVSVVLGRVSRSELFQDGAFRRHSRRNAAALSQAGVSWSIGSGGSATSSRFVGFNAQMASGYGATSQGAVGSDDWLSRVTSRASRVIGLGGRAGRLRSGAAADLVIWSGDPSDPGSRVEQVLINGEIAFDASAEGDR